MGTSDLDISTFVNADAAGNVDNDGDSDGNDAGESDHDGNVNDDATPKLRNNRIGPRS